MVGILKMIDLGINKPRNETRVVVAMSGGVDSSVTAALLVEAGYEVIGLTMQLYDHGEVVSKKTCCAGLDIYDARQVADKIGIAHYVLNYESLFKQKVMEDFADTYLKGETPIPCIRCNQTVKFSDMFKMARDLGAEALATGHYVQRFDGAHGPELHRAIDPSRDQSYFLFATTKDQLDYLRFPLGGMHKQETRDLARRYELPVAEKPDSQDICFVPDGNYARVVERLRPGALEDGNIVDLSGKVLGRHNGIINFTIGQRRGIGVSDNSGEPLYVISISPEKHEVVVGPKSALARSIIIVRELNWIGYEEENQNSYPVEIKIRSAQTPLPAQLSILPDNKAQIELVTPEYGVSGGQACVFYQGNRVLGGGWIAGTAK
jgi:tRNA-specific 2-thiouridylase